MKFGYCKFLYANYGTMDVIYSYSAFTLGQTKDADIYPLMNSII